MITVGQTFEKHFEFFAPIKRNLIWISNLLGRLGKRVLSRIKRGKMTDGKWTKNTGWKMGRYGVKETAYCY